MGRPRAALAARLAALAIPGGFLVVFFAYPLLTVLWRGLGDDPTRLADVFTTRGLRGVLWFTVWQALVSTALTVAVGLPAAQVVARHRFRGRALARAVILVPFVLPTVVVGAAINALFDAISLHRPLLGIVLAHVVFNVAVVVRVVGGHWALLDHRPDDAARLLGASPRRVFTDVTLPRLRPAIVAASAIVFLFCFTSFGIVMIVGAPRRATIETEIWRYAVQRTDFATAAALTVVQLVAVLALVAVGARLERRLAGTTSRPPPPARFARARDRRRALLRLAPALVVTMAPLGVLVVRSLRLDGHFTLASYRALGERDRASATLLVPPLRALANSLEIAAVSAVLATALGALTVAAGRGRAGRAVDRAAMLPLGVSAVSLGFGFLLALDEPPLDLRTSWWLVPIAQALVGLPFVLRIAVPAQRGVDPRLRDAAALLGAPPRTVWRTVDWPVLRRSLVVGALFAFAVALGEFGATSFLARPDRPTLPIAIFRLLGQPGPRLRGMATALAVLLSGLVMAVSLVSERLRPRGSAAL